MTELPKIVHHTDWLLLLIGGILFFLGLLRYQHTQRFAEIWQLPFHIRRREVESEFHPSWRKGGFEVGFSIVSYLVISLALFILVRHHESALAFDDWQMYLRIFFVLTLFFLLKNFLGLLVGWVFHCSEDVAASQNTNLAYRCWMSLVLLPLCVLAIFWQGLPMLGYILILIFIILSYLLAFQFTAVRVWNIPALGYYKIFYLCALEITPLVFLVGWLVNLY